MTDRPGIARASLHGGCRLCGTRDDLNDAGWCFRCWFRLDAWARPNLPPPRVTFPGDRGGFGVGVGTNLDPERLPYLLHTADRSRPIRATRRHWQRRPWQETPILLDGPRASLHYDRHGVSRIDVLNRVEPVLRCLICLGPPEPYRPLDDEDQSCKACDKAWRRTGRPWGDAFDSFVRKRRINHLRQHPADYVAALNPLRQKQTVQAGHPDFRPATRKNYIDVVSTLYNGGIERRLAPGLSVPYGWRRDNDDPGLLVPELTLEMWRADRRRKSGMELTTAPPPDQLATIIDIGTRRSEAAVS